jgi:hypothetical protein
MTDRTGMVRGVAAGFAVALAGVVSAGCPAQPAVAPAPCAPVQATLAAGARAGRLAGEYRLTLVATRGARAGRGAAGRLRLSPYTHPVEMGGGARSPLYGTAALVLDSVGATAPGDIGSASVERPGVRVIESSVPRPQVTLRFGANANGPATGQIEGAHLALFVDSIAPSGFFGRWDSGTPEQRSGGHFCAERVASP